MKIESTKYGTASEVAEAVGINRQTLDMAMRRNEEKLEIAETCGGTLLVSLASARKFKRKPPKRGPKPKSG